MAETILKRGAQKGAHDAEDGQKERRLNGAMLGGLAGLAGGVAAIVVSEVYKVANLVKGSEWSVASAASAPANWDQLSNNGFTLKELGYNASTQQWSVELLNNGHLVKDFTIGVNQTVNVAGPTQYETYSFLVRSVPQNQVIVQMSDTIKQHVLMTNPWWQADAIIGGIALMAISAATIFFGHRRLKKYNEMLRGEKKDPAHERSG